MNATITRDLRFDPTSAPIRLPLLDSREHPSLADAILPGRISAFLAERLARIAALREEPLCLRPLGAGAAGGTVGIELALHHPASGSTFGLVLGVGLLRPTEASGLPDPARNPLEAPGRLVRALFLHRLLDLLADLETHGDLRLELASRSEERARIALFFELCWGETRGTVELRLDPRLRGLSRSCLDALPPPPVEGPALPAAALPLHLALELGTLALGYPSLSALRVGDLLLLPAAHGLVAGRPTGPAALRLSPTRVALGRLTPDHFEIEALDRSRPLFEEKLPMSNSPLDAVRIDLRLRLGAVPLDLEQLASLSPGVVLPLPYRSPEVDLLVGDREVGRGELVELDGRLALRVTARKA